MLSTIFRLYEGHVIILSFPVCADITIWIKKYLNVDIYV